MVNAEPAQIDRLARSILAEVAPSELPQFPLVAAAFHRSGRPRRSQRPDPLAFGLETAAVAVSPVVIVVCAQVLDGLAKEYGERAGRVVRRWFRRGEDTTEAVAEIEAEPGAGSGSGAEVVPLSADVLDRIRKDARESALAMAVDADTADRIADRLVAELAVNPPRLD